MNDRSFFPIRLFRSKNFRTFLSLVLLAAVAILAMSALEPAPPPIKAAMPPPPVPAGPPLDEQAAKLVAQFEREAVPPPKEDFEYTIQSGDSLVSISLNIKNEYDLAETPGEIRQGIIVRNEIEDPGALKAGGRLTVPLSEFVKIAEIPPLDPRFLPVFRHWAGLDRCHPLSRYWLDDEAALAAVPRTIIYTVQQGDSLYTIAKFLKEKEAIDLPLMDLVQEIAARNDVEDPREVYPEMELEVAMTNQRTMTAMLAYEGFAPRSGTLRLHYAKDEIRSFMVAALKKYENIPEETFRRMLRVESGGDHMAISPVGAAGIMQIMPLTAKRLGLKVWDGDGYTFPQDIAAPGARAFYQRYARELQAMAKENPKKLMRLDDRFNPKKNIFASARLFSRLVAQYGTGNAVAAYNGGSRGMTGARAAETRAYMRLVLR
jgi:hypothetical protein